MQIKTKKKLDLGSKMHFRYSAEKTDSKICTNPRLFSIKKKLGGGAGMNLVPLHSVMKTH